MSIDDIYRLRQLNRKHNRYVTDEELNKPDYSRFSALAEKWRNHFILDFLGNVIYSKCADELDALIAELEAEK